MFIFTAAKNRSEAILIGGFWSGYRYRGLFELFIGERAKVCQYKKITPPADSKSMKSNEFYISKSVAHNIFSFR